MRPTAMRLMGQARPFAGWILVAVALGAAAVASSIGLMATSAYLLSAAALQPSIADLSLAIVGVRFFGLARGGLRYAERLVSHSVNLRMQASLHAWFYQAIEPLAPARLIHIRGGDLLARAVSDIETLQDFYVRVLAPPAIAVLTVLGMGWFLGVQSAALALVLGGFALLGGVFLPLVIRFLSREPGRMLVARRADLHAEVVETIGGLADLAAYGAARRQLERLNDLSRFVAAAQDRLARIQAGQAAAGSLLAYGAALAVLAVAADIDSVGGVHLASLALATLASFEAILPLASAAQSLESALPAARRLFDIADLAPAVPAAPLPAPLLDFSRGLRLEVEGLRFAYAPEEPPALDRVSFTLPDGARVAVVGPSGAGKTTLVNLLLRFWDFTQGEILLNGIDLRRIPGEMVRRNLSVISQTTYVFHASLRENLLVARPGASPAELRSALRRAQLEPLVMSLPEGLETQLGEHGLRLSAGERQRVGIARALLRDTPLLVLDEPTANLDLLTEHRVLTTLDTAMEGRTSLLITHRLVGMERPDEILVLDRGRVVERGQHSTLRCAGGMYQRLWELQNQAWAAIEGIDESPGH